VRPVLVVSNDIGNKCSPTVMVAAITKKRNTGFPTHVLLKKNFGLSCQSVVMLEQLRTIDKMRLENYVGRVDAEVMEKIDKALFISTGTYGYISEKEAFLLWGGLNGRQGNKKVSMLEMQQTIHYWD